MTDGEKLLAIEEIKQLKARYFYCVDCKDWDGFRDVFAPDADFDHRAAFKAVDPVSGASRVYGKPELLAAIDTSGWKMTREQVVANGPKQFADVSTVHQGFNPQITIHSPTEASGIWAMEDILRFPPGGPIKEIHGYGHYHETYRHIDGRWVMQSNTLKRTRIDVS
jgi:hypothetical protein